MQVFLFPELGRDKTDSARWACKVLTGSVTFPLCPHAPATSALQFRAVLTSGDDPLIRGEQSGEVAVYHTHGAKSEREKGGGGRISFILAAPNLIICLSLDLFTGGGTIDPSFLSSHRPSNSALRLPSIL